MVKPQPLRIAMLIDAWFPGKKKGVGVYGGGQVHVRELSKVLSQGYHCLITHFYPMHPNLMVRALWSFYVIGKIIAFHRKKPFDLIHSHGFNSAFPAKIASLVLHLPVIHTVHGSANLDQGRVGPFTWMEKWLLTQIKYDTEISVASKFKTYPNVNKKIEIIPNGVDVAPFDAISVPKSEHPSLIWVGRQDKVKGLDVLKKAILKVRKKVPHVKTTLVTGGKLQGSALIKAYKRSHVFVLSSLAEGQPITLLEAWAAKLPVVVTAVGDNPYMVKNGVNGYVVEPGNVKQLADAIIKVLRARENNQRMGQMGYELVKRDYSWEQVADKTYRVYMELMSNRANQEKHLSVNQSFV